MEKTQEISHFLLTSEGEGEIDIVVPSLYKDKERAAILRIILLKRNTIKDVKTNWNNNSVIIKFNHKELLKDDLFQVLNIVLANFSEKPNKKSSEIEPVAVKSEGVVRRVVISVEGMSCPSCALYLEMLLTRRGDVINASIDYNSKKGMVVGFLTLVEIKGVFEKHGYKVVGG